MPEQLSRRVVVKGAAALGIGAAASYAKPSLRSLGVAGALASVSGNPQDGGHDGLPDVPLGTVFQTFVLLNNGVRTMPTGTYPTPVWFWIDSDDTYSATLRYLTFTARGTENAWSLLVSGPDIASPTTRIGGFLITLASVYDVTLSDVDGTLIASSTITLI